MKQLIITTLVCALLTLSSTSAVATFTEEFSTDFSTFDEPIFELRESATYSSAESAVRLTPASNYVSGDLLYENQLQNKWFKTSFDFSCGGGTGGDGIIFLFTDVVDFANWNDINKGIIVDFCTWRAAPNDNVVRVVGRPYPDGTSWHTTPYVYDVEPEMTDNGIFTAEVEVYNNILSVWLENQSAGYAKTLIASLNVSDFFPSSGYMYLQGNTGTLNNTHYIHQWSLETEQIPEPSLAILMGLAVMGIFQRRFKS